jgi:hypothetical protein
MPNNNFIINFKTYKSFPKRNHIFRNLKQNSKSLLGYKSSIPPLDINSISIIRGGLLGDLTGIRKLNSPAEGLIL